MWKHQEERKELKSWQALKTGRLWEEQRDSRLLSINLYHMETVLEEKLEHVVHKLLSVSIGACQVSCLKLLWIHTRCIKVIEWKLFCIHFGQLLSASGSTVVVCGSQQGRSSCEVSRLARYYYYYYWLWGGQSGDRIPVGVRFFTHVQTGPGAHLASCTVGTGSFPGVESGRGVVLTFHPF
jgi:hypothetical protein